MFEATGGSNKGHVYGFGSESAAITAERQGGSSSSMSSVPSISSAAGHEACIKRERRLWGYMQQAQERFASFMTSFASQCRVQLDSVPISSLLSRCRMMMPHLSHRRSSFL
ncbi:hypothetical protein M9H77_27448 [Catharanthus roseus]|uniref:Uncharacterized protein n=1 Tax=Catharanthus roseus TaxID=4058 RepID=A0ACC0AEE9_CATRO|nr:hypothetical protein M9H77_27448 [Catharanthus roseus]